LKPTPATTAELAYLTAQVEALRYRLPHPIADMAGVQVVWEPRYDADNGILGSFSVFNRNTIRLAAYARLVPGTIVSVLCHELRHMHQLKTLGWRYHMLAMPFLRDYTIEPSAYEVEQAADKLIEMGVL
jgi:hypothetical protein